MIPWIRDYLSDHCAYLWFITGVPWSFLVGFDMVVAGWSVFLFVTSGAEVTELHGLGVELGRLKISTGLGWEHWIMILMNYETEGLWAWLESIAICTYTKKVRNKILQYRPTFPNFNISAQCNRVSRTSKLVARCLLPCLFSLH
jgi:hypothetical protein